MVDYYEVLGLSQDDTPTESQIKKAYHKKALKFHPDRMKGVNADKKDVAEKKFKVISEAYHVLSDPSKREVYDAHGEEGLRVQQQGGNPQFSRGGGMPMFSQSNSQFNSFSSVNINGNNAFGGGGFNDFFTSMGGNTFEFAPRPKPTRRHISQSIPISLIELYTGCTKKYRVSFSETKSKTYTITVKPGWKAGTKITYSEGDDQVEFVIFEKPHHVFTRVGNNLHWPVTISPTQADKKLRLTVDTLDGRSLTVETKPPSTDPVHRIEGEGMPNTKDGVKGSLVITFKVKEAV